MRFLILFVLWCILLVLCWPLALLALVAAPVLYLLSVCIGALLALVKAILFLPARVLGWRPC
ncbi:MAG: hypothetical protein K8R92_06760 [Planctomycetes bacterium]|nr:hypothetical protein [Planctomycetota bacterium]